MRLLISCLAILLGSLPARAVDNINLPGSDYVSFDAPSPQSCRNSCGGESRCQAWTWVKPGIQGPSGRCWLKDREPAIQRNTCCHSGSRDNITQRDMVAEDRINRPGQDINNFEVRGWQECQSACLGAQQCGSWTYVRPGVQGPRARCWLKHDVARPIADGNTISGVKFRPRSVRID